jgi:hypothetical protein
MAAHQRPGAFLAVDVLPAPGRDRHRHTGWPGMETDRRRELERQLRGRPQLS